MSTPENLAKRRRLNSAQDTLTKPFRSPLRFEAATTSKSTTTTTTRQSSPGSVHKPYKAAGLHNSAPAFRTPLRRTQTNNQQLETTQLSTIGLVKQQIQQTKNEIEILSRAKTIQATTVGSSLRLGVLITKWRKIAQTAADELFPSFADRQQSSGQPATIGNTFNQRRRDDDREDLADQVRRLVSSAFVDQNGDPLGLAEREQRAMVIEGLKGSEQGIDSHDSVIDQDDDDKDNDNCQRPDMSAMLRALNIEPAVIGWDAERETWTT